MTSADALAKTLIDQGYPCYPENYELDIIRPYIYVSDDEWNKYDPWMKLDAFRKLSDGIKEKILSECNTVVFEFPVKSFAKRNQSDVPVIEQLESMRLFSLHFTDHMPSSTITVKEDEWDIIPEWLHDNWDNGFVTASFLPHYGGQYPLLPFESIDEGAYCKALSLIPEEYKQYNSNGQISFKVDQTLLTMYERMIEDPDGIEIKDSDCSNATGCPVR